MNYQDTLDYLYRRLPMFTRDGASAYKEDLTNTRALCGLLDHPERDFRSIHVAGTNGKGSTSHALAAILQQAGYKTGLYTSPHLVDFRERIRIGGQMIPEERVIRFVSRYQADFERIQPSFFEVTVALAFDYFAAERVDIAIIETGLGGRLDSTNVIIPELSVITNIGWDHANMLGDTLPAIAREKAGIIKQGVPVVISEYQPDVAAVFEDTARAKAAPLVFASRVYRTTPLGRAPEAQHIVVEPIGTDDDGPHTPDEYLMDLQGSYQAKNLAGILAAVDQLRLQGWQLQERNVRKALSSIQATTGLRGRWEILSRSPMLVCDTGHNADGWREILYNIAQTPHQQLHMVIGVMADKDLSRMLPLLPREARYYFCQADLPRALPATDLAAVAAEHALMGKAYQTVRDAVGEALKAARSEDLVFVGGSTFIVGDLLAGYPPDTN